jgi:hypothetical protein
MTIPKKDKMKIMRSIRRDGKMNRNGSEGFNQRYAANVKSLSKAFIQRQDQYKEKNKWNAAELSQENMLYSNAPMHKPEDRVGNVQTTKNKFYEPKEQISSNLSGQTTKIGPININNFEFDTDPTTDNAFMTRRNSAQKMGYIFNERIYDNDVSPLSEVVNTRRYISAPVLKKSDDE